MNGDAETFQSFLNTLVTKSSVVGVAVNLLFAAILGFTIGRFYVRYGKSLSNRRAFASNFVLLTMTTALVITLIQSNIGLSLGMIGALSIVRFRSAIKEPEELAYLFLSIAVGLGLGASQRVITLGGLAVILLALWLKARFEQDRPTDSEQNLYLTIRSRRPDVVTTEVLSDWFDKHFSLHRLKRCERTATSVEACYLIEPKGTPSLSEFEADLRTLDDQATLSMLDTHGGLTGVG